MQQIGIVEKVLLEAPSSNIKNAPSDKQILIGNVENIRSNRPCRNIENPMKPYFFPQYSFIIKEFFSR